jgi:Ca2+/H+ antiporter
MPVVPADTVAAHAVIPAVRAAIPEVLVEATAVAAAIRAALAVAVAMLAASAVAVVMLVVAAMVAVAAAIGKQLRFSSRRLVCLGRRAFFHGL